VLTDNGWNASGTLASRSDGTLGTSAFGYDWASRLTSMSSPAYSGTLTFGWRLDGLLDGRQRPSGSGGAASFSYDPAKRPVAFAKAGSAASSFSQTYDRDGNVSSEGRSLTGVSGDAGANTQSFSYDGANRVTAASGLTATAYYAYDRDANRTSASLGGSTTTYGYDRSAQLISRTDAGVTTYLAYDAYGNQTSSAPAVNLNTASAYDLGDRLTSITPPAASATTFGFDALGRNLTRVTPAGTDTYEYVDSTQTAWRITTAGISINSAVDPSGARLATTRSGADLTLREVV
jgi:YD repeat-containing protein